MSISQDPVLISQILNEIAEAYKGYIGGTGGPNTIDIFNQELLTNQFTDALAGYPDDLEEKVKNLEEA